MSSRCLIFLSRLSSIVKQHPEYKAKLAKMEDKSQEVAVMNSFMVRPSGGMSSLDKKVINFEAENCTSFNAVGSRSFILLFNSSNSNEKLKGRRHYSGIVLPRSYAAFVNLIKAKLVKFEALSFTNDISMTAHEINEEWRREKFVLAIREMSGSHTADVINAAIKRILEEWEIKAKQCPVFLQDGAANMKINL